LDGLVAVVPVVEALGDGVEWAPVVEPLVEVGFVDVLGVVATVDVGVVPVGVLATVTVLVEAPELPPQPARASAPSSASGALSLSMWSLATRANAL